jgi:FkbM family methyltransferase
MTSKYTLYLLFFYYYCYIKLLKIYNYTDTDTDMDIPIVIISFNNYKYVKNTLEQIKRINIRYYKNIIIMDNCSTCKETLHYLQTVDVGVVFNQTNNGPWIQENCNSELYHKLPNKFIISDPDLQYNENIPSNFIDILSALSDKYGCNKIGFALDIQDFDKMYQDSNYTKGQSIYDWESKFWESRIDDNNYELYVADIDTTFCLTNKLNNYRGIRIAGNFLAKHIPWYVDNKIYNRYDINKTVYNANAVHSSIRTLLKNYSDENYESVKRNNETFFINKSQQNINFFKNIFSSWENDTFVIFDRFLKKNKTFIDVGAWVGTTGMYGSRLSKDIICVEADSDSYRELEMNMKDNCEKNYKLINKAIYHIDNIHISFGKNRFLNNSQLNDSTSQIYDSNANVNANANVNVVETITIKRIIEGYNVNYKDISLIKVDIEGGEENILEDLYYIYATYNVPLYVSFHYSWWNDKNLDRFAFLSYENKKVIYNNPFISILFQ